MSVARGRHCASLRQCSRALPDDAAALAEFWLVLLFPICAQLETFFCFDFYCGSSRNVLLRRNLDRLQRVKSQLARVVLKTPSTVTASATDMRRQLHWLPVRQRLLSRIWHGCLDSRRTYSVKFTITSRLELCAQLQLFSYSSNQPLYHLQRERFVQPFLLQSGTLLVSTPVQLIRFHSIAR